MNKYLIVMDGLPYYIYFQIYIIKFYIKIDLQKFTEIYCSRDFSSYLRVQLLMVLRSFDNFAIGSNVLFLGCRTLKNRVTNTPNLTK